MLPYVEIHRKQLRKFGEHLLTKESAVIIVLAMNLVGSLLISALVVFPAMSAMRVCRSYKGVTVCSAIISVCCTLFGILFSIVFGTPVGCTVVLADVLVYIVTFVSGRLIGRQQG